MSMPPKYQCFRVCLDRKIFLRALIEVQKRAPHAQIYDLRVVGRQVGEIQKISDGKWYLRIRGIYWQNGRPNLSGGTGITDFRTHKEAVAKAVDVLRGVYES